MAEATMRSSSRPSRIVELGSFRASAISAAGSFHGRVSAQRSHSDTTAATSASSISAMASPAIMRKNLEHLAGIHDAVGIEHRLECAHQLDRGLVLDVGQLVALEHADTMLR